VRSGFAGGCPRGMPDSFAASILASTRSTMSSRSYSATVARVRIISRLADVAGSIPSRSIRRGSAGVGPRRTRATSSCQMLDRSLASRRHVRERIVLLRADGTERIELQLRVLAGGAGSGGPDLPSRASVFIGGGGSSCLAGVAVAVWLIIRSTSAGGYRRAGPRWCAPARVKAGRALSER